jgi:membrane protein YdbS with pleckstrin-like domain
MEDSKLPTVDSVADAQESQLLQPLSMDDPIIYRWEFITPEAIDLGKWFQRNLQEIRKKPRTHLLLLPFLPLMSLLLFTPTFMCLAFVVLMASFIDLAGHALAWAGNYAGVHIPVWGIALVLFPPMALLALSFPFVWIIELVRGGVHKTEKKFAQFISGMYQVGMVAPVVALACIQVLFSQGAPWPKSEFRFSDENLLNPLGMITEQLMSVNTLGISKYLWDSTTPEPLGWRGKSLLILVSIMAGLIFAEIGIKMLQVIFKNGGLFFGTTADLYQHLYKEGVLLQKDVLVTRTGILADVTDPNKYPITRLVERLEREGAVPYPAVTTDSEQAMTPSSQESASAPLSTSEPPTVTLSGRASFIYLWPIWALGFYLPAAGAIGYLHNLPIVAIFLAVGVTVVITAYSTNEILNLCMLSGLVIAGAAGRHFQWGILDPAFQFAPAYLLIVSIPVCVLWYALARWPSNRIAISQDRVAIKDGYFVKDEVFAATDLTIELKRGPTFRNRTLGCGTEDVLVTVKVAGGQQTELLLRNVLFARKMVKELANLSVDFNLVILGIDEA